MQVEQRKIEALIPYVNNSRTHSDEQVAQIAASVREFGWTNPILVDGQNGIIAGHGRLAAARKLELTEVPVIVLDHLSEAQKKALVIADNKLASNAGWDDEMLRLELGDLQEMGFDATIAGFTTEELDALLNVTEGTDGLTDEDDVPEAPDEPTTRLGDVWILGRHRLMCGDSGSIDAVDTLMDGGKADFVYMDPPYGMNLNTNYARSNRVKGNSYSAVIGDDQDFDPSFFFEYFKDAREHFWWGADYYCQTLPKGGSWVVWDKKKEDLDESIGTGYELCWSMIPHKRMVARFLWSGFTAKEKSENRVHPTQKPIALHKWFFDRWGKPDDVVVDLFGGSGSTLIACERTARQCRTMELDPRYCDVIVKRWQEYTGKAATHAESGIPFDSMTNTLTQ
jgi:DNA modification methylase